PTCLPTCLLSTGLLSTGLLSTGLPSVSLSRVSPLFRESVANRKPVVKIEPAKIERSLFNHFMGCSLPARKQVPKKPIVQSDEPHAIARVPSLESP
ncbi:MAG: hypothetical protein WA783_08285, partial [Phormidesmis sp.]